MRVVLGVQSATPAHVSRIKTWRRPLFGPEPAPAATAGAASAGTNSGLRQVFIRDTCAGVADCTPKTTRISLEPGDGQQDNSKPAGPALSGLAKQIALANGKSATVFTPTVPVDDRVFLAITNETK